MPCGRILLFKGKSLVSRLIAWQTRGEFSHVAVQFPDGRIFEAFEGSALKGFRDGGVRYRESDPDWSACQAFEIQDSTSLQWELMQGYAEDILEQSSGYDYWGVLRFISRRRLPRTNTRYFCSEVVMEITRKAQISLLSSRIPSDEVSPWVLSLSPRLLASTPLQ